MNVYIYQFTYGCVCVCVYLIHNCMQIFRQRTKIIHIKLLSLSRRVSVGGKERELSHFTLYTSILILYLVAIYLYTFHKRKTKKEEK